MFLGIRWIARFVLAPFQPNHYQEFISFTSTFVSYKIDVTQRAVLRNTTYQCIFEDQKVYIYIYLYIYYDNTLDHAIQENTQCYFEIILSYLVKLFLKQPAFLNITLKHLFKMNASVQNFIIYVKTICIKKGRHKEHLIQRR